MIEIGVLVVEVAVVILLVLWTRRRARERAWPRWYPAAPVIFWGSALLAVVSGGGTPSFDEATLGGGLMLGAGVLGLWAVIVHRQRSWVRFTLSKTGGRLPVPGEPTCKEDGNAADGTCERCGDWVCPACVKIATSTKKRYCYGCAEKIAEGS
jgi:hypothetical protein